MNKLCIMDNNTNAYVYSFCTHYGIYSACYIFYLLIKKASQMWLEILTLCICRHNYSAI